MAGAAGAAVAVPVVPSSAAAVTTASAAATRPNVNIVDRTPIERVETSIPTSNVNHCAKAAHLRGNPAFTWTFISERYVRAHPAAVLQPGELAAAADY